MASEPGPSADGNAARPDQPPARSAQTPAQPRMLHPSSLLFQAVHEARRYLIPAVAAAIFAAQGGPRMAILLGLVFIAGFLNEVFRYLTTRYMIRHGELVVWRGLFFRSERHVPTARIQNIDTVQNLLHRWFAVAEVRIETASGAEPEAVLRVLALHEVDQLRSGVFGDSPREVHRSADESEVARPLLLRLGLGELVTAGLISNRGLLLVPILIGLFFEFGLQDRLDLRRLPGYLPQRLGVTAWAMIAAGAVLFGLLALRVLSIAWYVLRFFDYRMELDRDDLRIGCGLITRVAATVPRRRIQFISVHRTLFGRWCGRATIRIETAGGGAGQQNEDVQAVISRRWFAPTIRETQIPQLLTVLRPGVSFGEEQYDWHGLAPGARRRLMRIAGLQALLISVVGYAVWQPWGWQAGVWALPVLLYLAHLQARARRYARTAWGVAYRSGILVRKESYTFFDKIQTVEKRQSPLDRRWHMATLSVDTPAAGPAGHRIQIALLDERFAEQEAVAVTNEAGARSMQWS